VLSVGDRFENPRTAATLEVVRVPSDGGGVLEVRRLIKPGNGKTIAHVHRDYVERFVIEAGEAVAKVDGREVRVGPGEELEIPVGHRHVNAYNAGTADLVMRHAFEPASDFALGYVETLGHLMRESGVDRQGEVPVLKAFAIADATGSQTFAAGVPDGLQRAALFRVGALIARLSGTRLHVP
jgi:mannose-6-phosphate isomerase-like protein (cupin superfamily)